MFIRSLMKNPHANHIPMRHFMILSFLLSFAAAAAADDPNRISINCGGAASAAALTGRQWLRDAAPEGSSTIATVNGELTTTVDPVPYKTARISRTKFSYYFPMSPGQKLIRLHFNPVSYHGFESFNDLFTVEAGPFTLLANFSASLTARALSVNTFVKEFCVTLQENQPLTIVFSPETSFYSKNNYAFINGIDIISVPSTISYCHGGDTGVRVLSRPGIVFSFDNTTALERVHRQHIKWGSASSRDDIGGMFVVWYLKPKENDAKEADAMIWRVSVDVGFRYLVRLHFCEVELRMDFRILIDDMVAFTSADMLQQRGDQSLLWYETYMVMVEGRKREDKRSISISLNTQHEYIDRHGPLEGFEVFKLSNHDHSLASPNPNPNPLPPRRESPSQTIRALLGRENAIATLVFTVICLVNTIVWGANFFKEKNKPSVWSKQPCRRFSLAEILSATENFASVLENGGFGEVYKGCIDNGREIVAIKRLKQDLKLGEHQFSTEVETLAKLRHVNLVSLIGYCREKWERMLVYEYMASGTLADHLHKQARKGIDYLPLSWKQRLKICIGVGRALDYLHTGHGVIHGDLKPSNILLDESFVTKISDFGFAKLVNDSEWQSQYSTTLGGVLEYMDPSYYQTGKATRESDTYSFGVVLLEVLCGRAAVGPWHEEGMCSLSMWAMENIDKGQVDHIVDPSLRGEISPNSLNTFLKISQRCLHDEPEERPAAAHIVTKLELALQQQEKAESLALKEDTSSEDVFSSTDKADSLSIEENKSIMDYLQDNDTTSTILSVPFFNVLRVISVPIAQMNSTMILFGVEGILHPWKIYLNSVFDIPASAPISRRTSNTALGGNNVSNESLDPTLKILSIEEIEAVTKNFSSDTIIGKGGYGRVYKGWIHENPNEKKGSRIVTVKMLIDERMQGFKEWQMKFLGTLSHPNLVTLLGFGWNNKVLFLVHEFMQKGSLENHLSGRGPPLQPMPWHIRLRIAIGAARGLAFLHSLDTKVIYRDFKSSNILLDEFYNAKISDFGLAKVGPEADATHVSTRVMGTHGYAAPEYIATGHLTTKSDVHSFGVVLLELLTGLVAIDSRRPAEQQNLVDWMKPHLSDMRKLNSMIDPCCSESAPKIAQLALNCLQMNPKCRPTMQQVVDTLESFNTAAQKP